MENYRSVAIFGTAVAVTVPEEKNEALRLFTEQVVPGRWAEVRPPTAQELKGTAVLKISLDEASAKVRTGGPVDDEEDYMLPVWAGVLPLKLVPGEPVDDRGLVAGVAPGFRHAMFQRAQHAAGG